jgi:hypothetical protein
MNIEATNLQDFDKQYFAYFRDNSIEETEIKLKQQMSFG